MHQFNLNDRQLFNSCEFYFILTAEGLAAIALNIDKKRRFKNTQGEQK
jgi:hypothetical protein